MARLNRTRFTILGCLTIEPMSGYDIKRFIDRTISHFWNESYGQIYPTLQALEEEGMIAGEREPGERGPDRVVFRITNAGKDDLARWLQEPAEPAVTRYEHSLKLFFGHVIGPSASLKHVERLRKQTRSELDRLTAAEVELEQSHASWAPYWLAVLRGGLRYSEMVLAWCDATERDLRRVMP